MSASSCVRSSVYVNRAMGRVLGVSGETVGYRGQMEGSRAALSRRVMLDIQKAVHRALIGM